MVITIPAYEELLPRLEKLLAAHEEDLKRAANLESRIASLLQRYSSQVRFSAFFGGHSGHYES